MLRSLFVLGILAFGLRHAVRGPFYALLLYLWLAYFRPESWLWDPAIFMALNLSFLVGVFCLMLAALSAQLSLNGRVILLILMVVQSMFSTITSPYLSAALPSAIDYAKAMMMTWMIASLATSVARLRLTIVVICLSLGFESAKQGWAQLLLNPGARNDNTLPSFGDNNLVAVGMFALVALIIALSRTATRRWERWGYRLLAVGIIYRGLSTYSRGGFICAATLGVMFILRSKRRLMPIVALATVSALLLPVLPTEFWDRIASVQNVPLASASAPTGAAAPVGGDADTVSAASRMYFWSLAVEMANQHPLSGVGHNAFKNAFGEYDSLNGAYGRDRAVHSMWFGMLAELGYPGLFIMVGCVVLGFVAARRARRNRGSGPEALALREFGVALETSLVVICIGGAFVNFQDVELFWHTIGLTIAINTVAMHAARPAVPMASQPIAAIA